MKNLICKMFIFKLRAEKVEHYTNQNYFKNYG